MVEKRDKESDEFEAVGEDEEYTDSEFFDPEAITQELDAIQKAPKRSAGRAAGSARATIEELLERKRLQRAIREFDDDEYLDPLY